ncbi:MAG: hypothetical protein FJ254_09310 [Phycisphaerae bacterium]|nr:hypothetical protein [Phycisphaerae bacterium]
MRCHAAAAVSASGALAPKRAAASGKKAKVRLDAGDIRAIVRRQDARPARLIRREDNAMLGKVVTFETQNQRLALLAVISFIALC